jgi:hypothetical protein
MTKKGDVTFSVRSGGVPTHRAFSASGVVRCAGAFQPAQGVV